MNFALALVTLSGTVFGPMSVVDEVAVQKPTRELSWQRLSWIDPQAGSLIYVSSAGKFRGVRLEQLPTGDLRIADIVLPTVAGMITDSLPDFSLIASSDVEGFNLWSSTSQHASRIDLPSARFTRNELVFEQTGKFALVIEHKRSGVNSEIGRLSLYQIINGHAKRRSKSGWGPNYGARRCADKGWMLSDEAKHFKACVVGGKLVLRSATTIDTPLTIPILFEEVVRPAYWEAQSVAFRNVFKSAGEHGVVPSIFLPTAVLAADSDSRWNGPNGKLPWPQGHVLLVQSAK